MRHQKRSASERIKKSQKKYHEPRKNKNKARNKKRIESMTPEKQEERKKKKYDKRKTIPTKREPMRLMIKNQISRYVTLKIKIHKTYNTKKAKLRAAEILKMNEDFSIVGLSDEQIRYRIRKINKYIEDLIKAGN